MTPEAKCVCPQRHVEPIVPGGGTTLDKMIPFVELCGFAANAAPILVLDAKTSVQEIHTHMCPAKEHFVRTRSGSGRHNLAFFFLNNYDCQRAAFFEEEVFPS